MEGNIRTNHELRLKAFDLLQEFKVQNTSEQEIVGRIHNKFGINKVTLSQWYSGKYKPWGRKGELKIKPDLFYVLGALLGDGCLYRWEITSYYIILSGDNNFTTKYADAVNLCINTKTKSYPNRGQRIWVVRSNNYKLYSLFKKVREDLSYLESLIERNGKKSAILFIEGFFDAEGCVKIIKEKVRKTPKICLDITNTNYKILELVRRLLKYYLNIQANYSIQKSFIGKDGFKRKKAYHLRIYKKEYIRKFLENIDTTKLKKEKVPYVKRWLNNGL